MPLKYIIKKLNCNEQQNKFLESLYDKTYPVIEKNDDIYSKKMNNVFPTYGELCGYSIDYIISKLNITKDDVFYDLGSGNGNVCAQFLLQTPVKKSVGIELSISRHNIAIKLQDKILQNCKDKELIYINDNISNINFSDATIIFTNSVMFSEEFMNELEYKASICKNLKYFISLKSLTNPKYLKLFTTLENLSCNWGSSHIYIYT